MSSVTRNQDAANEPAVTKSASHAGESLAFLDLKAQFAAIRGETMDAVTRVMETQIFILGAEVRLFEEELAAALGAKHAVACASGSDALLLAMMSLGIGVGDEVITTPFTFVATAGSIARLGAKPVFSDIDPETLNIDPEKIEAAITSKTKAIIPVHLFGLPADLSPIQSVANRHKLAVIEDAAQAIGARYQDRFVGTIGDFGCFSFFPSKNLGCAGDGGLITTQDSPLADKLRLLRAHGSRTKYHHEILGMNSRLDALQAAILRVKLRHLDSWTRKRGEHANRYRFLFEDMGLGEIIRVPRENLAGGRHAYNQFTICCPRRDELREFLRRAGVPTEIYYPFPLHLQPAFSDLGYRQGDFPNSEKASLEALSLPVYPELHDSQREAVVRAIADFYYAKNQ